MSRELDEVRTDPRLFQWNVVLTPSQRKPKGKKEGKAARGRKEQPGVCCNPTSSDGALF